MANEGVPPGGMYPSRQELTSQNGLGRVLGPGGSDLSADRRYLYGKQLNRIFTDNVTQADAAEGYYNAGQYFAPDQFAYGTATDDDLNAAGGASPAFVQWDVPTSSTNYQRPRTVAAGYDADRKVMTVVFRDGTFYNYYEVTPSEWSAFYASYSKGKPWLNRKNGKQAMDGLFISKPRGRADDISEVTPEIRQALYRVAVAQQQKIKPKVGRTSQKPGYLTPEGATVPIKNRVGRTYDATRGGSNPATANRQVRRKAS